MGLLSPADIAIVSALLDLALDQPAAEREAWLAALPEEHQRHVATLRAMLAEHDSTRSAGFLASGPQLGDEPGGGDAAASGGESVGAYRLLREIGRGGMGSVWLAERADGAFERQVALKLPRLSWADGLAERMARERRIGALLEHPHIARLYDAGLDERGRPYLALEYIEGQPIDTWCREQRLDVKKRLRLFVQVVRAVAYAHGRLVVHRDLKPSNVLVSADGQAHLLDFGIAKLLQQDHSPALTQEQSRVMTPHYASPEQIAGEPVSVQSDVYSLGVLLYELLTGVLPYEGRRHTLGALEEAILQGDAPPASSRAHDKALARQLRGELDAIVAKAMQRERARRYANADALGDDIERYLKGEPVTARPDSVAYRWAKFVRRNWLGVAACSALLIAILTGSGMAMVQAHRAERAAERERLVKTFVADVFRLNSRVVVRDTALGPDLTQEVLQDGAKLIQQRFAGQLDLQAELFGVVGGVFSDMGAYQLAAEYATRRVEAMATLGAAPREQVRASLTLAQALHDNEQFADAELRARRVADRPGVADEDQVEALVILARSQTALSEGGALQTTLDRMQELQRHRGLDRTTVDAWLQFLQADRLSDQNRFDEALPLYERAIELALRSEGPGSLDATTMRLDFVWRLAFTRTLHPSRAVHHREAVRRLRQLGGVHRVRAIMAEARYAYAGSALAGGRYASSVAELRKSRVELSNLPMAIPPLFPAWIDFWLGDLLCRQGNVLEGLPLLESSAVEMHKAATTINRRRNLASAVGRCAMFAGQHEKANALLVERLMLRREGGQGQHPWAATDYYFVSANLTMAGRYAEAEAVLSDMPRFEDIRGEGVAGDSYRRRPIRRRAAALLGAGNAGQAIEALQEGLPSLADDYDLVEFNTLMAEALCLVGNHASGLAVSVAAIASLQAMSDYAHPPWVARARAVAGLCALGKKDPATARRLARLARISFTAQPKVSPYYKAPLIELERALGLKLPQM